MLLGLAAISAALGGRPAAAGALIALAAIADTFDGRFAGLFSTDAAQAGFGAELDSLCDACTFGVAPVVCTAALAGTPGPPVSVMSASVAASVSGAAVTRLAFYNVTHQRLQGFNGAGAGCRAALVVGPVLHGPPDRPGRRPGRRGRGHGLAATDSRPAGAGILLFASWPLCAAAAHDRGGSRML